jgi:hypothetical protein
LTCNIKDIAYSNRADGNDEAEVDANQRKGKVCIRCVFLYGNIIIKRKKKKCRDSVRHRSTIKRVTQV